MLGASLPCLKTRCRYHKVCTDESKKDSREFDNLCPEYTGGFNASKNYSLHKAPCIELNDYFESGSSLSFAAFSIMMEGYLAKKGIKIDSTNSFWDYVCFTEFVQFIIPHTNTLQSDIREEDNNALEELLCIHKPDIVICWGGVINSALWKNSIDVDKLKDTEYYIFHWKVKTGCKEKKQITFVNCDHPSSKDFILNYKKFEKYLDNAFAQNK